VRGLLSDLFDSESFMPHGHCYLWRPDVLWLNVGSDVLITFAYYTIPLFLVFFVKMRKDLVFNWIFVMFALFILACGTTHLFEIWTVWHPDYAVHGIIKLFTAGVSVATAVALVPLMPKALKIPSSRDLEDKTRELELVNEQLRELNASLERRVEEKTRDLTQLAAIVEFSNDAIIAHDMQGAITAWNRGAENLFGYAANEAIGKSVFFIVPPKRRQEMAIILARTSQGLTAEAKDTSRLTKSGTIIEVSLMISPIKDGRGRVTGASSIARDISARKEVERRLYQSEARKSAILSSSLDAIITIDHTGKVVDWNDAAEKTFELPREQALERPLVDTIIPEQFRDRFRDGMARYLATGECAILGKRILMPGLKAGGQEVPLELSVVAIAVGDGPPTFTAAARDISSRLQFEAALRSNQERFRRVIEAAPNGLLMIDCSGRITLCNAEVETLFGYDRKELIGRPIEALVPERFRTDHPGYRSSYFAKPETRQMGAGRDLFGLRKDGAEFPVEIGLNPLETDEGSFVLASIVDISKRKRLEERVLRAAEAVQQKNQEMEQFVYTVSHDLKSPLVTSTGFLGFLKEDFEAQRYDKLPDSIRRLEDANGRMSQLIDDLLQLSRAGRIKLVPEPIDMAAMAHAVFEGLSPHLTGKKVKIEIQDSMPKIVADRKRTYQALDNLISNAMKYACDGTAPAITVGSEQHGREVHVFVRDNGPGIAPRYHKKIFGLFQRLETDNRGTGVGLTIVARIMQQHGGRVWVESELGKGATFWLAFPGMFSPAEDHDDAGHH
jgi:PAS domain S-box-containing protein